MIAVVGRELREPSDTSRWLETRVVDARGTSMLVRKCAGMLHHPYLLNI